MKILLLVPDKANLERVTSVANQIVRKTNSSLNLLSMVGSENQRSTGERALARAQEMTPDVLSETSLLVGGVNDLIGELTRKEYSLVILGRRQTGSLRGQKATTLVRSVVQRGHTSALLARRMRHKLNHFLICTSGAEVALPVVENGAWLAKALDANATLLHVASSVPRMYTGLEGLDETLSKLLDTATPVSSHLHSAAEILSAHKVQAELKLRHGSVVEEIFSEARETKAGLIVIGAPRSFVPIQSFFLASVAWQVVERTNRSLLVVCVDKSGVEVGT